MLWVGGLDIAPVLSPHTHNLHILLDSTCMVLTGLTVAVAVAVCVSKHALRACKQGSSKRHPAQQRDFAHDEADCGCGCVYGCVFRWA